MEPTDIRSVIAKMVIGTYMLALFAAIIYPFVFFKNFDGLEKLASYFSKASSAYTGIIGVIVGYYFARNTDKNNGGNSTKDPGTGQTVPPDEGGGSGATDVASGGTPN